MSILQLQPRVRIVTSHGAVVHDNGGYGMLGSGHGPDSVIDAMSKLGDGQCNDSLFFPEEARKVLEEAGHSRGHCPFTHFICMNSGSESVTVSLRIADVNAKFASSGHVMKVKKSNFLQLNKAFMEERTGQLNYRTLVKIVMIKI